MPGQDQEAPSAIQRAVEAAEARIADIAPAYLGAIVQVRNFGLAVDGQEWFVGIVAKVASPTRINVKIWYPDGQSAFFKGVEHVNTPEGAKAPGQAWRWPMTLD